MKHLNANRGFRLWRKSDVVDSLLLVLVMIYKSNSQNCTGSPSVNLSYHQIYASGSGTKIIDMCIIHTCVRVDWWRTRCSSWRNSTLQGFELSSSPRTSSLGWDSQIWSSWFGGFGGFGFGTVWRCTSLVVLVRFGAVPLPLLTPNLFLVWSGRV